MDNVQLRATAKAWIEFQELGSNPSAEQEAPLIWAYDAAHDLVARSPYLAWKFVLSVVELSKDERVLGMLAAGPVEDLLVGYGAEILPDVLSSLPSNPALRRVLAGVWTTRMDREVARKIASIVGSMDS